MRRNMIGGFSLALILVLAWCATPASMTSAAEPEKAADTGESLWKEKIAAFNDLATTLKACKQTIKDKKTAEDAVAKLKPQIDKLNDILKRYAALNLDDKEKKALATKHATNFAKAMVDISSGIMGLSDALKMPEIAIAFLPALMPLADVMQAATKDLAK